MTLPAHAHRIAGYVLILACLGCQNNANKADVRTRLTGLWELDCDVLGGKQLRSAMPNAKQLLVFTNSKECALIVSTVDTPAASKAAPFIVELGTYTTNGLGITMTFPRLSGKPSSAKAEPGKLYWKQGDRTYLFRLVRVEGRSRSFDYNAKTE